MVFLKALFDNYILICAAIGYAIAQLLKLIIFTFRSGKLQIGVLVSSGGMPSSHSATVAAMTTAVGRVYGVSSPLFAISLVVALVVMYDATGVRRETGEQAKLLNILVEDLKTRENREVTRRHFKELVGHTPIQVLAGAALGIVIPYIYASGA